MPTPQTNPQNSQSNGTIPSNNPSPSSVSSGQTPSTFQAQIQAQISATSPKEIELNRQLGLMMPQGVPDDMKISWQALFRIIRTMYVEELIEKKDAPKFLRDFYNIPDKRKYAFLQGLTNLVGEKLTQNAHFQEMQDYFEVKEKTEQIMDLLPTPELKQEFLRSLSQESGNTDFEQSLQEQLTAEEIEELQKYKLSEILENSRRRPKNSFNQVLTPAQLSNIVDAPEPKQVVQMASSAGRQAPVVSPNTNSNINPNPPRPRPPVPNTVQSTANLRPIRPTAPNIPARPLPPIQNSVPNPTANNPATANTFQRKNLGLNDLLNKP